MVQLMCSQIGSVESASPSECFQGLDAYSLLEDPAQHLITADADSTVNDLDDL